MSQKTSQLSRLLKLYRKRWCDAAGNSLSQEKLSEVLGYAGSTYGQWERGERRPQRREDILPLIEVFQKGGSVKTLADGNALLAAAGFADLQTDELPVLIGIPSLQPEPWVQVNLPSASGPSDPTIYRVFDKFPDQEFSEHVKQGQQIRILTTWIPLLDMFFDALINALHAGAHAEILMLHPASSAAVLRSLAISALGGPKRKDRVQNGVHNNLTMLADVAKTLSSEQQQLLQIRLYHSLPSVLLYQVDVFCLAGFYFHGYMASYAPQLQVNLTSRLGQTLQKEFETLWAMSQSLENITNWQQELEQMATQFTLEQQT